jgi:lipopolysaccharide assembly outer membrane protein LptD (OstA)
MRRLRALLTFAAAFGSFVFALLSAEQSQTEWEVQALSPEGQNLVWDLRTGTAVGTNGVLVRYGQAVLTADRVTLNQQSGEAIADGRVRIQQGEQLWASEHVRYNFKTGQMQAEQFRTGKAPVFVAGEGLHGDITNGVYTATNGFATIEDIYEPAIKVRARHVRIVPGKFVEARHATLYLGETPIFYFPFYRRSLDKQANQFSAVPGYRSRYGPYLLGSYTWFLNEYLDGTVHLDWRERRGVGFGPDVNYHLGRWGEGTFKYYNLDDANPGEDLYDRPLPEYRQRLWFSYQANPLTNVFAQSLVRYQRDSRITRDFFEGEYRQNPQPNTYFEVNKFWQNWNLDAYVQPRINDFLETVERLPDVRLSGYRQQLGASPFYYESESSGGYYRRLFAVTNGAAEPDFAAARADSYHQVTLPSTFFGWLNFVPRVGGRFTWYSEATESGGVTEETHRGVFNTGAEVSMKASRLWPSATNRFFDVNGVRHIIEPSVNYVYVPRPAQLPPELPQFDYELPSLRLLPVEYPDYNAIDSIDSQNVLRFGLRNKVQTKRDGHVEDLLNWEVFTDWRLRPREQQTTFSDIYSDLAFKPRSWITLESLTRFDIDRGDWQMAFHTLTLQPNDVWSWGIGHWYLRDDFRSVPTALGQGNNLITSRMFYRLNENWGFRASHHFEARDGRLEEQQYAVYRDFRSWSGAVSFRLRDNRSEPDDFTVAFTFSLKVAPRVGVGGDALRPYTLIGN